MKLTFKQIEPFVKKPNPDAKIILIYGPDQGLMKERTKIICKTVVNDINDPFNVATFTSEKILSDPAAFYDEANAQSLMGGNRLIHIKDGTDSINLILKDYLTNPSPDTLIVIEAENLGPKSSLRKLCETSKNAAALPCYVDDERNLAQIIKDMCVQAKYKINQDALIALSSALVGDRIIARGEIEKLLLFKGLNDNNSDIETITIGDVTASCGDVRDWSMDKLVYAIGDGDVQETHTIIQSLFKDQIAPIVLLRSTQNHFLKLFSVQAKINDGLNQFDAIKTMHPPLFFKVADAFKRQLNKWSIPVLESAIDSLNKTEALSKKTGYSDESLITNCLIQLSRYNPRQQRFTV